MTPTKAAHELATILLSIAKEAPRCLFGDYRSGVSTVCDEIATHRVEGPHDQDCGEFCERHSEMMIANADSPHRYFSKPQNDRIRLNEGWKLAVAVLSENFPRDYLSKTPEGRLLGVVTIVPKGDGSDTYASVLETKLGGLPKLPGGGVEDGESILEAASRETLEEVSLEIVDAIDFHTCFYSDYEVHFILATPSNIETFGEGDAGPVAWATEAELASHPVFGDSIPAAFRALEAQRGKNDKSNLNGNGALE